MIVFFGFGEDVKGKVDFFFGYVVFVWVFVFFYGFYDYCYIYNVD